MGLHPKRLWYNPNNWGQCPEDGWGTWAFTGDIECWCGEDKQGVYVQSSQAPFTRSYEGWGE